ncbi:UvrD-helicase domain-containing protein [Anaplasma phagocytophilum]|uniref:UvrD-helicase domain-containing protein n=1 Tax=Anaplasma phagocytophilum TaxID=948 RepID=UPI00200C602F|nr:UvrD-helicase domain-containing protein [Anaplasma phagocytophilum]UQD54083.1 exodeoxyribonuclease V [Anaplasma phagocytophilum]
MHTGNLYPSAQHKLATDPTQEFVWISASAGTGKTRMLVHRVIRLLMAGHENILCLTFTNAAAYEIKERIFTMTEGWMLLPENELIDVLRETCYQNADDILINRARNLFFRIPNILKVQTVHGFCKSLISSFPSEAGISDNFEVRELSESYPKIFYKLLHESDYIAEHLKEVACELKESTLFDLLYKIMKKPHIDLEVPQPTDLHVKPDHLLCPEEIIDALNCGGLRDKKISTKLRSWNNLVNKTHKKIEEYLKTFICIASLEKKDISSIASKQVLQQCPTVGGAIVNEQEKLLEFAEQYYSARISKRTFHIMQLVRHGIRIYEYDKKNAKYLNYDDIINLALKLISDPTHKDFVLFSLDSQINHILVDESQDNSLEQWHIVAELCNEFFTGLSSNTNQRTLFVVGDVKQSIYGFQNARPDYFHFMHKYFAQKSTNPVTIQLSDSFRSTPPILSLVDKVFNTLREQVSFQSQEIVHNTHRANEYGYVEIWPLLRSTRRKKPYAWDLESIKECGENADHSLLLAQTISQAISSWIKEKRKLQAKNRPVEASDILILVRHRSVFVDQMIASLKQENIPVTGRDRCNIMDYVVIQDLVNLGEFLLLPENDISLATLLKSPIFRYTDSMLFEIVSSNSEKCSLWNKLQKFATMQETVKYLKLLISISQNRSPLDLYFFILSQHKEQFIKYLGQTSVEIIEEFINLLIAFQSNNLNLLEYFIQWIKSTNPVTKSDMSIAKNLVRIMTVHSAKGMQAPIVFLPDTTSVPKCDLQVVFDDKNTPLWCASDTNSYCKNLKLRKSQEEYNEYLRLLYVAMTRAEDELYIAGIGTANSRSWYDIITNSSAEILHKKNTCLSPMFSEPVDVLYTEH